MRRQGPRHAGPRHRPSWWRGPWPPSILLAAAIAFLIVEIGWVIG
jgi:hypothetical protein